jgi:hypothetical protein
MSTEETETPVEETEETTEATEEAQEQGDPMALLSDVGQLEVKITRFSRLRDAVLVENKKWTEEHLAQRKALLEEHGLLEQFEEWDKEIKARNEADQANLSPISACIQVLSEYRMAIIQGRQFEAMDTLEKVWVFEDQVFNGVKQKLEEAQEVEIETEGEVEEKVEETGEE